MSPLELRHVSRIHGSGATAVTALDDVSLTVAAGELVAVMGPSGSGKSTLLNLAGGLDRPTTGDVVVDGTVLSGLSPRALAALRRRSLGYVFQDLNLMPALTAAENVALPLELDGVAVRRARATAVETLERFGLVDTADRFPDDLSGGEQQRVAIARAVVGDPAVVLADEPTGNLDSRNGAEILGLLHDLHESGSTVVTITHDPLVAHAFPRRIALRDGRVDDVAEVAA